jgi:subtilisin family serine protease
LRDLESAAVFDYDHVYSESASAADAVTSMAGSEGIAAAPDGERIRNVRVGLIDGGVQLAHSVFHGASIEVSGCDGRAVPSAHGTAIASLLIGDAAAFHGAAPGARLYAADVYCGRPTGGAVDAIVAAFGWLHANQVAVINISLVGPDNLVLRQVVRQMVARGHLLVAAVGNDGPAAPPLYPAAYPGVIGVTAVDVHRRALLEAERGPQVSFAAPGADIAAATVPEGYQAVRGTSFAAPIVAGLLAARLSDPDPDGAQRAVDSLAQDAIHLGSAARDTTFGLGLVGASVQTAPGLVNAVRPIAP